MGCDIHMYVEYAYKQKIPLDGDETPIKLERVHWHSLCDRMNPGRDYTMFSLLSDGVRGSYELSFPAKGLPPKDELGWSANGDAFLYICDKEDKNDIEDNECTLENALRWTQGGHRNIYNDANGNPRWVDHPDWHSHSWLTTEEYAQALDNYYEVSIWGGEVGLVYSVILSMMRSIEERGATARIIFWFDN